MLLILGVDLSANQDGNILHPGKQWMELEQVPNILEKNSKAEFHLYSLHQPKFNWIKDLHINHENMKILEETWVKLFSSWNWEVLGIFKPPERDQQIYYK